MDILPIGYFDDLKRCLRRRRYQRLEDATKMKRKLKIVRLGKRSSNQKEVKIKKVHNSGFKMMTPVQLITKFHETYVDAMTWLGNSKRIDIVKNEAKRIAKCQPIPMLSASTNEMVDSRLVMEIYKRVVVSTREQQSALIPEFY